MKTLMRLSAMMLLMWTSSLSQVEITKGSYFGVGLAAFKSGFGESFLAGPTTGVFVIGEIVDGLGIRPDVSYETRGEASALRSVVLHYVNVGLFLDYNYTIKESIGLTAHGMLGPVWSPLLRAEDQYHFGSISTSTTATSTVSRDDFGWMVGTGIGIGVGNGTLVFDAKFFLGTQALSIPGFGYPMLNRSVVFTAGFEF